MKGYARKLESDRKKKSKTESKQGADKGTKRKERTVFNCII